MIISPVIYLSLFLKQIHLQPVVETSNRCRLFLPHKHMLKATAINHRPRWSRPWVKLEPEVKQQFTQLQFITDVGCKIDWTVCVTCIGALALHHKHKWSSKLSCRKWDNSVSGWELSSQSWEPRFTPRSWQGENRGSDPAHGRVRTVVHTPLMAGWEPWFTPRSWQLMAADGRL